MKLSKITHRRELRIRVDFTYNAEATARLKQIPDARWSQSLKCWHVPYTKEVFEQLKELFPEVEYPTTQVAEQSNLSVKKVLSIKKVETTTPIKIELKHKEAEIKSAITVTVYPKIIEIKMPKDEADIQFIRSFKFAKWNTNLFCWTVPNYGRNADILKSYFGKKDAEITDVESQHATTLPEETKHPAFTKTDFLVINTSNRTLRLYFVYNVEISKLLKKIPMCIWNSDRRCWEMPYSEKYMDQVKQIAAQFVLNFVYHEEKKLKVLPRKSKHDIENYRTCPQNYINKLTELRYSQNTIDVYT
ncbi:MAG: hypothetical protein ACOYM7_09015, partial [Paludibacter sp.]